MNRETSALGHRLGRCYPDSGKVLGYLKIRGIFLGVPITRLCNIWRSILVPHMLGNTHLRKGHVQISRRWGVLKQ